MVVMSSNFDQRGKDHGASNPGSRKADGKNFGPYSQGKGQNQVILHTSSQGPGQPVSTGMPETFVSGFYPSANSGFPMSFQNYNQAPWSTGTNTQQGFDPPNFGFGGVTQVNPVNSINPVNAAPGGGTENQPYLTDHLFTQNSSGFQNPYSGPFMNGTGISSWSYFNNPSSFFFPTGNADLNLTWGPENPNPSQLFQDLYKPPPPPEHEKARAESGDLAAFANGDIKTEDVGKALSHLNVSVNDQDTNEENEEGGANTAGSAGKSPENPAGQSGSSNAPKLVSWASVAKQPAKPKPPSSKGHQKAPVQLPSSNKGSYSNQNGTVSVKGGPAKGQQGGSGGRWVRQGGGNEASGVPDASSVSKDSSPLLQKLSAKNNFNPKEFSLNLKNARTFIIKSYSEDDIFRSIKYSIWTSTEHGNRKLSEAFKEQKGNPVYLLYSVNGSGHFCGVAMMMSEVDLDVETGVWVQDKWKGRFDVKWVYVKDVPNSTLRHIRLENNENKPVTNSRDTQEVPHDKAKQVLKIIHSFKAQTSIFDDFSHYEKRQEDDFLYRGKPMLEVDI